MKGEFDNHEPFATIAKQQLNQNRQDRSKINHPKAPPNVDKSTLKCTHYNKTGQIKSHCFKLVGYPKWWDHNRELHKKDSMKTSL